MKFRKLFNVIALSIVVSVPVVLCASDSKVSGGDALYGKCIEMYYNSEYDYEELKPLFLKSIASFSKEKNGYMKSIRLGWAYFILAEAAKYRCETEDVIPFYDKSLEAVNKAILYDTRSSEAKALKGLLYINMWSAHGGDSEFSKTHGSEIFPLLNEAVTLDKKNVFARIVFASYLVQVPQQWGGDVDGGIAMLKETLVTAKQINLFSAYCNLAEAYKRKNMSIEEKKSYKEALKIYPNNAWVNVALN